MNMPLFFMQHKKRIALIAFLFAILVIQLALVFYFMERSGNEVAMQVVTEQQPVEISRKSEEEEPVKMPVKEESKNEEAKNEEAKNEEAKPEDGAEGKDEQEEEELIFPAPDTPLVELVKFPLEVFVTRQDPSLLFETKMQLGKGSFGVVYKSLKKGTSNFYALKKILIKKNANMSNLTKEVAILKTLDHPNIIKFYEGFLWNEMIPEADLKKLKATISDHPERTDYLYLCMELIESGDLKDALSTNDFTEEQIAEASRQILLALQYLHSNLVIHRDMKSRNTMIDSKGNLKLIDFGLSIVLSSPSKVIRSRVGTPAWMSPEMLTLDADKKSGKYSFPTDIWSFCNIVREMMEKKPPYRGQTDVVKENIVKEPVPPVHQPDKWSPQLLDFLDRCFQKNPHLRPTAADLLQHPFIVNNKFDKNPLEDISHSSLP